MKGKSAEDALYELAQRSFLTDWCYPNPRWPDGKELCDLLLVFDSTAIIWQVKDLQVDADGQPSPSEVQKNLQQLAGARRHLFDLRRPITLSNPRRGPELFDAGAITEVFLISALMGPSAESFPFAEEFKRQTIHVMPRAFLEKSLRELDTIADFTQYLRAKEELFRIVPRLVVMGGEEELLGHYIISDRSFAEFHGKHMVVLEDGFWHRLQTNPQYLAKKQADRISYGWDSMIDRVHEGSPEYEPVARELARPHRFLRRYLAKVFLEAHERAHGLAGPRYNVYRRVLPTDGVTYVFLFQEDEREVRGEHLYATCLVARGRFSENQKVVGIATAMKIRPTCSYHYCFLDMATITPEAQHDITVFEEKLGILQNVQLGETSESEYPSGPYWKPN